MSIKIHHGPDGTYKTSGAIKDDILKVIKTGRLLITNVRGFSKENAIAVLGEKNVHADFDVVHIDTEVQDGRDRMARFFHWAPNGAFFVIDEVQRIFPPKWTEKDLKLLDLPYEQDDLPEEKRRPENFHVAWDMQRHYNWDFVFTTTNIAKVHTAMRQMAKVGVRHVNLGIWRFYKTVEHDAESNGKTAATQTNIKLFNYVPSKIFDLYASTKTGEFENVEPRAAFYKDPKILAILLFICGLLIYSSTREASIVDRMVGQDESSSQTVETDKVRPDKNRDTLPNSNGTKRTAKGSVDITDVPIAYLKQFDSIYLTGLVVSPDTFDAFFTATVRDNEFSLSSQHLRSIGFKLVLISDCLVQLTYRDYTNYYVCKPRQINNDPPESNLAEKISDNVI